MSAVYADWGGAGAEKRNTYDLLDADLPIYAPIPAPVYIDTCIFTDTHLFKRALGNARESELK